MNDPRDSLALKQEIFLSFKELSLVVVLVYSLQNTFLYKMVYSFDKLKINPRSFYQNIL